MSGIDVRALRRRLRRLNPIVALTNPVNIDLVETGKQQNL